MTPDTYYGMPMPVCPYCGYEATCTADLMTRVVDGGTTASCHGCEREYLVELEVVHTFTTRPKE